MVDDQSYTFSNLLPYFKKSIIFTPPNYAKRGVHLWPMMHPHSPLLVDLCMFRSGITLFQYRSSLSLLPRSQDFLKIEASRVEACSALLNTLQLSIQMPRFEILLRHHLGKRLF